MPTNEATFAALATLRDTPAEEWGRCQAEWEVVRASLLARARAEVKGSEADVEDIAQQAVMRVIRGVGEMKAETAGEAAAWLKRIVERLNLDRLRKLGRARLVSLDAPVSEDGGQRHEVVAAEPPTHGSFLDREGLELCEEALWDQVSAFLEGACRPHARRNGLRNAQVAYLVAVHGRSVDDLRQIPGLIPAGTQDAAVHQWSRRGRADRLIPAVEAWIPLLEGGETLREFAEELLGILLGRARTDEGQPRPERRKDDSDGGSVSDSGHCSSEQYDDEADDD